MKFKWWRKEKPLDPREEERMRKVQESQFALLNAATTTADVAQDVTLKLKARLDDSLRQLELTSNLLSDALITCTSSGVITTFNPAAERIFNWPSQDIVGKDLTILFRDQTGKKKTNDEIIDCLNAEPSELDSMTRIECVRGRRRSGESFYVDGDLTFLERQDGTTIVMILIKDITTRVELQKQLQLSETRYRGIFESSFDGILVVQNFYVVAANPAIGTMLGYETDEMIAKPATSFFHQNSQQKINTLIMQYLNGDVTSHCSVVGAIASNGQTVDLLLSCAPMQWEGKPASLIGLKDITEIMKTISAAK